MSTKLQTFQDFKEVLKGDLALQDEFKKDPLNAIQQFDQKGLDDKWVYRVVVSALGIAILLILVGVILLMFNGKITGDDKVPTIFTAIGSAAIGALAGLLAPSPRSNGA